MKIEHVSIPGFIQVSPHNVSGVMFLCVTGGYGPLYGIMVEPQDLRLLTLMRKDFYPGRVYLRLIVSGKEMSQPIGETIEELALQLGGTIDESKKPPVLAEPEGDLIVRGS